MVQYNNDGPVIYGSQIGVSFKFDHRKLHAGEILFQATVQILDITELEQLIFEPDIQAVVGCSDFYMVLIVRGRLRKREDGYRQAGKEEDDIFHSCSLEGGCHRR